MNGMQKRQGFTLVELLVVIAIIGLLIALLLPAVQAARESARRTECANHLKQLALAVIEHEQVNRFYPSGGWGWGWVGDPDRGYGLRQPGSWGYSVLQYLESQNIYYLDAGPENAAKQAARAVLAATPVATFICPSRREVISYPWTWRAPALSTLPTGSGKSDYAINAGSQNTTSRRSGGCEFGFGPSDSNGYSDGDSPSCTWWINNPTTTFTGISYQRSEIRQRQLTDGTSKVYMLGEKYLIPDNYHNGLDDGDNTSMYTGYTSDNFRVTSVPPFVDTPGILQDDCTFGSAHPGAWNAGFCDGSVHAMSYEIDAQVHLVLGNRSDGLLVDPSQY